MEGFKERLRSQIADKCIQVEDLFSRPVHVTCIVRVDGNNEADVLVTSEKNLDEVVALIERSRSREPIRSGH